MAAAGDAVETLRWLEISGLPPGLEERGSAWLEELGVKAVSLEFGSSGSESPDGCSCIAECASAEEAEVALGVLAGASLGGRSLRVRAVGRPGGAAVEGPSMGPEQGPTQKAEEATTSNTASTASTATAAPTRLSTAEVLEQRAKRKAAEAAASASAYKKFAAAGRPEAVVNPATGETAVQRAKRKAKEAAEALHAARRARQEAERSKEAKREKERAESVNALASLYDGLPEPDPEKDAAAARIAEATNKLNETQKIKYTEDRSKVVFLDIDGVLRPLYGGQFQMSSISMDGENVPIVDGDTEFIPSAMQALRLILEQTGAALVLSSEWRRHPTLREGVNANLRKKGLPTVVDDTPTTERELTGNPLRSFAIRRAREIGHYLKANPYIRQWVALDDIDLGEADEERIAGQPLLTPRFVLTEKTACLQPADAQMAVNILNGKLNPPRVFE